MPKEVKNHCGKALREPDGKRGIVLACAAFAAVLSAKGIVHTNGLHDGPG